MYTEIDDLIQIIESSILFDGDWYKTTYLDRLSEGTDKQISPALHYLTYGWQLGYDPSIYFSTLGYYYQNRDLQEYKVCPLLHYEMFGIYEHRRVKIRNKADLLKRHPECMAKLEGGLLRIRITNRCNGKCRYCGLRGWNIEEQMQEMNPTWYFEYCKPLYDKLNIILITGGDAFVAKESYNYMKFISEAYPTINIFTESNGIAFDEKYQIMAAENLFLTHFSINASNAETFERSCWDGNNAETAYETSLNNIQNYLQRLEKMNRSCFAPNLSMVINRDNASDIYSFLVLCLKLKASYIMFFFDYTENDMNGKYFGNPETSRAALRTLVEAERVLAKKVFLAFRLWIPSDELVPIQEEVERMDIDMLRKKYAELLKLAEGRDMASELEARNRLRRIQGKNELSFEEDWNATARMKTINGKRICAAPWSFLDIYPSGRLDFCGWFCETLNIQDYVKDNYVDWDEVANSIEYMIHRNHILHGNYKGCQACCPMNDITSPITGYHDYGYYRKSE